MRMPGFTAEASMYQSTRYYVMTPSVASIRNGRLVSIAVTFMPFMPPDGGNGGGVKGVQCTDPDPSCRFGFRGHRFDVDGNRIDTGCCIPRTTPLPTHAQCDSAHTACLAGAIAAGIFCPPCGAAIADQCGRDYQSCLSQAVG